VRTGSLDMVITSTAPLVGILPSIGVFDLPFLFSNEREADQVLDGKAGDYFTAKLTGVGLVNLAWWENGFRNTTNSKRAIVRLEDFDGVKMRVMQNPIYIDTFKALGRTPCRWLLRGLLGAGDQDRRRPGEPVRQHRELEVLRSAEVPDADPPRLQPAGGAALEEDLGHDVGPGAGGDEGVRCVGRDEERRVNREQAVSSVANLKSKGMIVNDISPPRCSASATAPGRSTSSTARRSATRRSTWCSAS
jgi:hypothetical protein